MASAKAPRSWPRLWGVFIWREFRTAPTGTNRLLAAMFAAYVVGLSLVILARCDWHLSISETHGHCGIGKTQNTLPPSQIRNPKS